MSVAQQRGVQVRKLRSDTDETSGGYGSLPLPRSKSKATEATSKVETIIQVLISKTGIYMRYSCTEAILESANPPNAVHDRRALYKSSTSRLPSLSSLSSDTMTSAGGVLFDSHRSNHLGGSRQITGLSEPPRPHGLEIADEEDKHEFDTATLELAPAFLGPIDMGTHRSLVIIRMPWTSRPLRICGPMPLNKLMGPSFSMMNCMTSTKVLNGFPWRAGGGFDCRPTLATIRGCVTMVARALDIAPRAGGYVSSSYCKHARS